MKIKTHFLIILAILSALTSGLVLNHSLSQASAVSQTNNIKTLTPSELSQFNGTNPNLPIYLALNGNVYDVTAGKEFYQTGGSYHYLAGRDSSTELNLIGGGIIKRKYPVIGKLISPTP
jgi:predicted heme/steroid binding protein